MVWNKSSALPLKKTSPPSCNAAPLMPNRLYSKLARRVTHHAPAEQVSGDGYFIKGEGSSVTINCYK
jgi:hypothetical protein